MSRLVTLIFGFLGLLLIVLLDPIITQRAFGCFKQTNDIFFSLSHNPRRGLMIDGIEAISSSSTLRQMTRYRRVILQFEHSRSSLVATLH